MSKQFKLYERALRLYPRRYQSDYAEQMIQTLEDMLADQPNQAARVQMWLRAWLDLAVCAAHQNLAATQQTASLKTSHEVRFTTTVGGSMLLPFVLILLTNAVLRVDFHHDLYRSWLWSTPVLTAWVVVLPGLALLTALVGYVKLVRQQQLRGLDLQHLWPVILVGLVGLGVLLLVVFHDSTQCLMHNPIFVIRNTHQTLQCVHRGMFGG